MAKKGGGWPEIGKKASNQHVQAQLLIDDAKSLIKHGKPKDNENSRAIGIQCPYSTLQKFCESVITHLQTVLENDSHKQLTDFMLRMETGQDSLKSIIVEAIKQPVSSITQGATPSKQGHTWAEIARNAHPPPSIASKVTAPGGHPAISKATNREILIKINDIHKVQALRTAADPPRSIVSKIITGLIRISKEKDSIKDIEKTRVSDARILPSGNILIHTETPNGAEILRRCRGWVKNLGEQAEIVISTYGVVIHGIPIKSVQLEQQEVMINRWKDGNQNILGNCDIRSLGWLTKPCEGKAVTSLVMEFGNREDANRAIHAGSLSWGFDPKQTVRYDRECRIHQCFKCYQYGHKGPQCRNSERCGICAGKDHRASDCPNAQEKKCAVCNAPHYAWSPACEYRQKEKARVKKAREDSAKYWEEDSGGTINIPRPAAAATTDDINNSSTFNSTFVPPQLPPPKPLTRGRPPIKKNTAEAAKNVHGKRALQELKPTDINAAAGKKRVIHRAKIVDAGPPTSQSSPSTSPSRETVSEGTGPPHNPDNIEELPSLLAASPPASPPPGVQTRSRGSETSKAIRRAFE